MIAYVVDAVRACGLSKIVLVVGHQASEVMSRFEGADMEFALQEPQLGTGHAVAAAKKPFEGFSGEVLILCGDVPLITPETLKAFQDFHRERSSKLTVMTTLVENPRGYGRIVRELADN